MRHTGQEQAGSPEQNPAQQVHDTHGQQIWKRRLGPWSRSEREHESQQRARQHHESFGLVGRMQVQHLIAEEKHDHREEREKRDQNEGGEHRLALILTKG
jgi:hypothetical protein